MYDVIIIGGGPAGLSAALLLGRSRRDVLVLDSGKPRNGASRALHGFRDGWNPHELRRLGREELARYPTVVFRDATAIQVHRCGEGFQIELESGGIEHSRLLLFATGRNDAIPAKLGFERFYGRGVFHCPFCDGWENRDRALVCYCRERCGVELALELLTWSNRVTLCTDGPPEDWAENERARLAALGIRVKESRVLSLEGDEEPQYLRMADGTNLPCEALFFCTSCSQKSSLPETLGCCFDDEGSVRCEDHAAIGVPGVYIAGNVRGGLHLAIAAAAEGAQAAVNINEALLEAGVIPAPTRGELSALAHS